MTRARTPVDPPVLTSRDDGQGRRLVVVEATRFLVFQVYYDEASRRHLEPLWTPYRNAAIGPFFESAVIAELLAAGHHRRADYFGVLSWKFGRKVPLAPPEMFRRIQRDGFDADVYSFFGRIGRGRPWSLAEPKHPGILEAASVLMRRLGIEVDLSRLEAPVIYQNHFLCRSSVCGRFGRELLAPALNAMADQSDTELQSLLLRNACYEDRRLPVSHLMAIFGRPYFCLHPFVAERLFSTWLALNPDVRTRHIWRGRFVEADNVRYEPEMRTPRRQPA